MKSFLDENFILQTATSQRLYHDFAKAMPIIDYHNHLIPEQIANDHQFANLTAVWLHGDHYKWRAMRTNGVDERFITGDATDEEKFMKWAETMPFTMRNPLYHWSHLELQRYFDVHEILSPKTAKKIYDECSAKLQTPAYSVKSLLRKMNVKVLCTTDDPIDDLRFHQQIKKDGFEIKVLPTFRPDKAMNVDDLSVFNNYVNQLQSVVDQDIIDFDTYKKAIKIRHDYFAENGGRLSDHGLSQVDAETFTEAEIKKIFLRMRNFEAVGQRPITTFEKRQFKSAMLIYFAHLNHEKGWTQQFHLGALRNNNSRLLRELGPDTGFDSIGDYSQAEGLSKFMNSLDNTNQLTKTIIYNLKIGRAHV